MRERHDARKEALIGEAADLAVGRGQPDLADFLRVFLERGAAEDVSAYAPAELFALAEHALAGLKQRAIGHHRVTVSDPDIGKGGPHGPVTVVEILNDDMPFLVDSVMQELAESAVDVRLLVHPILSVVRDAEGRLTGFAEPGTADSRRESLIHIHVARLPDATARSDLARRLDQVLTDVRAAVSDWPAMRAVLLKVLDDYRTTPPPLPADEVSEAIAFLSWLADDNFTFLGYRDYDVEMASGDADRIALKPESGLGILRDPEVRVLRRGREMVQVTAEIRDFMNRPEALIVAKANVKSRVHRRVHMDYVGVKRYAPDGRLDGEIRLVGLFTATAYTRPARTIPYLRHKVERVIARAGFEPNGHSAKTLEVVLDTYPRDDLFQIDFETLYDFALAILELSERPRIRVLPWRDRFDRFVSVLVYVPRDRYTTEVRIRIGAYLKTVYDGVVSAFYPFFPEGSLTRCHFIIGRYEGETPNPPRAELEAGIAALVRTWDDAFQEAARGRYGADQARAVLTRWQHGFPPAYRESYDQTEALNDAAVLDRLTGARTTAIGFRVPRDAAEGEIALKLFHRGGPLPLSERVPVLEATGFRVIEEQTFDVALPEPGTVIHDMRLVRADGLAVPLDVHAEPLRALAMAIQFGQAESDRLNALLVPARLAWREIALLRALSRYLQQARLPYDQSYVAEALNRQPAIAALIVAFFAARFDPDRTGDRSLAEARVSADIDAALEAVTSLDDDQILRRLVGLVKAALRTTFYQIGPDGRPRDVIAVKFDPALIDDLPAPRPFREIWVYAPRVEGVHLRFGMVARGGLRWSDRPQDFRTEVLGLVKAQQVKNAVIVPVGAKGGFFPKRLPAGPREAVFEEGTATYRLFVGAMLDLTDNLVGDAVVPPDRTVRHDGDDPYLVVAADKGTATFSDTANGIADAHGFWLSDAFASGGSVGYDHKKMGITARGAWEAVKRHFREMGRDTQTEPFTVAGVGDMSGDVFGNGMLLSPEIRLVAAFDHRDIFLDPAPDPAVALAERTRLFALPRSSWADYDRALISAGGGVFSRTLKSVPLSPEVRAALGTERERMTPTELIRLILKAPVDLLWFGGIGTYVRGPDETDAEAGDKANDAVRVTAGELAAKVVGEGANLGMTQRARIAYNLAGGRSNSDAVDNSAGVNSSDMEVNIKIALGRAVREGRLARPDRDALLAAMTDDVARLVLANNHRQTLAVSLGAHAGMAEFGHQRRLIRWLEERGRLDRAVETLPDDAALAAREAAGRPLTRAEIGVLVAYAKIVLFDDLIESRVPDDPALEPVLLGYFPPAMRDRFADDIRAHRLRREIIATVVANRIVNLSGPTAVLRLVDRTGALPGAAAEAWLAAAAVLDADVFVAAVDALDGRVHGLVQNDLYARFASALLDAALWILTGPDAAAGLGAAVARLKPAVAALAALQAGEPLGEADGAARDAIAASGVPADLADRAVRLPLLVAGLEVIRVADVAGTDIAAAAAAAGRITRLFGMDRIGALAASVRVADHVEGLALDRARRTLADAHRRMAAAALGAGPGDAGLEAWLAPRRDAVARTKATLADILSGPPTVARLTVAAGLLADVAG